MIHRFFLLLLVCFGFAKGFEKEKLIFTSFVEPKTQVVSGEKFEITLEAQILSPKINSIKTVFKGGDKYKIYNKKNKWKKVSKNKFVNSYYIELNSSKAKIPTFEIIANVTDTIKVYDDEFSLDGEFEERSVAKNMSIKSTLIYPYTKIISLSKKENYCNVVAKNMNIVSYVSKKYDDNSSIVLFSLEANLSNIEDFNLRNGALEKSKKSLFNASIDYYIVVPKYKDKIVFSYFNTQKNDFETLSIPIDISIETLSTQTELNPKENRYIIYKNIFLIVVLFIFLIIFIIKKKILFLIFAFVLSIVVFITMKPYDTIMIPKNTPIKILPTKNSTIIYKTQIKTECKKLYNRHGYTKVLLPNEKIGWISNEDIIEVKSFFYSN